jgi:hypothetical protein
MANAVLTIRSEKKHVKPVLEKQKDKVVVLTREIATARSDLFQVTNNMQMISHTVEIADSENPKCPSTTRT